MDLRESIEVNGVKIILQAYSELRHKQLEKVNADVDKYIEAHPDQKFSEMTRSKKAEFWMRKAQILWEPKPELDHKGNPISLNDDFWSAKDEFFTKKFFEDEGFEHSLLKSSEDFFLTKGFYL